MKTRYYHCHTFSMLMLLPLITQAAPPTGGEDCHQPDCQSQRTLTPTTTEYRVVVKGDANLLSTNIKNGVTLFGVTGDPNVVDTRSGNATAEDIKAGKKAWVDGELVIGTAKWGTGTATIQPPSSRNTGNDNIPPPSRYTDNDNGTVTDNQTGLIWLKNANCFDRMNWNYARWVAQNLKSGNCGLNDGSTQGTWRLPTLRELETIIDSNYIRPALSNMAGTGKWSEGNTFWGVQSSYYWSATTHTGNSFYAWYVNFYDGFVSNSVKNFPCYVWPVRGGQ